jgi:hypothetical protein
MLDNPSTQDMEACMAELLGLWRKCNGGHLPEVIIAFRYGEGWVDW